jgi:hypothetical protein
VGELQTAEAFGNPLASKKRDELVSELIFDEARNSFCNVRQHALRRPEPNREAEL